MKIFINMLFTLFLLASMIMSNNSKGDNSYVFDSTQQEQDYREIINQLRCPKCQNQSIADSDAPLSEDLRFIVYQKLKAGENKATIFQYMQERYGDFVLYAPPVSPKNYVLWFMPLAVFLIIIVALLRKVGRRELVPEDSDTSKGME